MATTSTSVMMAMGAYFSPKPASFESTVKTLFERRAAPMKWLRTSSAIFLEPGPVCFGDRRVDYGRIGLELGRWNLAPSDVRALQRQLPNIQIVDAPTALRPRSAVPRRQAGPLLRMRLPLGGFRDIGRYRRGRIRSWAIADRAFSAFERSSVVGHPFM
jgi:hypothetical protein